MNHKNVDRMDRRCAKTRKAIKSVFIQLMTEKDISKITIKEIAEKADINRKTFYFHYKDVNAVLDDIEDDALNKICGIVEGSDIQKVIYNPYTIFQELTNIINADVEFYKYLIQSTSDSKLLDKVKDKLKEKLIEMMEPECKIDKKVLPFAIDFAVAGTLSVYQEWFNSDRSYTLEQISEIVGSLNFKGPYVLLNNKR